MTTFYICRHGQTENNLHERLSGWIDTPLTINGIKNAKSAARKLHGITFDTIISSDLGRAFYTAYIIAREFKFTDEIKQYSGLREVNYGDKSNMRIADVIAKYPDMDYNNPGGETLAEMQQRVLACINEIGKENPGKTILVAAHDGTINAIYSSFINEDCAIVGSTRTNAHDFVGRFTHQDGKITLFEELTL